MLVANHQDHPRKAPMRPNESAKCHVSARNFHPLTVVPASQSLLVSTNSARGSTHESLLELRFLDEG